MIPRYVMDTSVLVSGFRSDLGASYAFVQAIGKGHFQLVGTVALLLEYEAVMLRPGNREAARLTVQETHHALNDLVRHIQRVSIHFAYRPLLRDPNDEHVIEAAINGSAHAIVTHNVDDFLPAADEFAIRVLRPGRILKTEISL